MLSGQPIKVSKPKLVLGDYPPSPDTVASKSVPGPDLAQEPITGSWSLVDSFRYCALSGLSEGVGPVCSNAVVVHSQPVGEYTCVHGKLTAGHVIAWATLSTLDKCSIGKVTPHLEHR